MCPDCRFRRPHLPHHHLPHFPPPPPPPPLPPPPSSPRPRRGPPGPRRHPVPLRHRRRRVRHLRHDHHCPPNPRCRHPRRGCRRPCCCSVSVCPSYRYRRPPHPS